MIETMQSSTVIPVSLSAARAAMAECMLGEQSTQLRVGDITLHPHQRSAATRIQRTIAECGGALLCDDVGLGKTYVALAVATGFEFVTVIAPASLADMWRHALGATRISAEFISIESLGRAGAPDRKRTLIIVDEAHHFRNPCTRRYAALARMCMFAPVLLLTATPLHNTRDDVSALAALFMGSRAYSMTPADLTRIVVRRDASAQAGVHDIPVIEHVPARVINTSETMLDMIIALPPPVPASDGSVAASLVVHGLVRQWASSNAALVGALKRRIARSHGLLVSLDAGRYPTAAELSAWVYTGDAVQLAFAELLSPANISLVALATALREHVSALTQLLDIARGLDDRALAGFVREIRAAHPDEKIIAFSCYAETADSLYRSLMHDGHAALLTARGAMIASGPVSRAEIMEQFEPCASAARPVSEREEVNLLIATDLLSEGVNLQRASVIVHLDLPWTAARLEQRIGRLARIGSPHERVISYSVNPSPRAEAFLHELEIITRKSSLAGDIFGDSAGSELPEQPSRRAQITCSEHTRTMMEQWRLATSAAASPRSERELVIATAVASSFGAVGAWVVDGDSTLLAYEESAGIVTDAPSIERYIGAANVDDVASGAYATPPDSAHVLRVLRAARAWYDQRRAWLAVGGSDGFLIARSDPRETQHSTGHSTRHGARRSLARVADATSAGAGFSRRSGSAAIAARLRQAAAAPLPLAVEWSLESLSESADEAAVNTILDIVDRARPAASHTREQGIRCVALIMLGPEHV
jgi:hypothetical protein